MKKEKTYNYIFRILKQPVFELQNIPESYYKEYSSNRLAGALMFTTQQLGVLIINLLFLGAALHILIGQFIEITFLTPVAVWVVIKTAKGGLVDLAWKKRD